MKYALLIIAAVAASLVIVNLVWSRSESPQDMHSFSPEETFAITPSPWPLTYGQQIDTASIEAEAFILVNENNQEIIAHKNEDTRLPMASTTKIMTAAIVLEFAEPDSVVTIPPQAIENLPGDSALMGISPGEKYTIEDLLYGLLLSSGNDAANALAYSISGGTEQFVALMNQKAQQLKLENTQFKNPSGLDQDGHYSTAKDLAIITNYARSFDLFKTIVAATSKTIPYTETHKYIELTNLNSLIATYPGATGVKPGNTGQAGNCLVASVNRQGQRYIGVLLNTPGRNTNMARLFDLAYAQHNLH